MCGNRHKVLANFNNSAFCFSAMLSDNLAPIVLITLLSFVFLPFKVDILESINLCGTFSTEFAMVIYFIHIFYTISYLSKPPTKQLYFLLVVELLDVWSSRRKYEDDNDSFDESLGGDDQGELDVCTAQLPTISFLSVMIF